MFLLFAQIAYRQDSIILLLYEIILKTRDKQEAPYENSSFVSLYLPDIKSMVVQQRENSSRLESFKFSYNKIYTQHCTRSSSRFNFKTIYFNLSTLWLG